MPLLHSVVISAAFAPAAILVQDPSPRSWEAFVSWRDFGSTAISSQVRKLKQMVWNCWYLIARNPGKSFFPLILLVPSILFLQLSFAAGSIPAELGKLAALQFLSLQGNPLRGESLSVTW